MSAGTGSLDRLPRRLGLPTATSVVVANMIGTGIFTTTGLMLSRVESGWLVLLCWTLGGIVALCGALSYAELAVMMPRAGAEYVYLREIYGPLAGFLSGWVSFFVGFSAPIAATGVACAKYLAAAGVLPGGWAAEKALATGLVVLFTAIHYRGLRPGAAIQNALTGLKLLLVGGLLLAGFIAGGGSWNFLLTPGDFRAAGRPGDLGVALLWVMFAYSGWNAARLPGGGSDDPGRGVDRPARPIAIRPADGGRGISRLPGHVAEEGVRTLRMTR